MVTDVSDGEVGRVVEELGAIGEGARREFGALSAEQVNWKPGPDEWSVGQCLEHLIKTNRGLFHTLESVARGERRAGGWERWSPLSGFFGRFIARALEQEGGRKFKAPAKLSPSASGVAPGIVEEFAAHQAELARLVRAAAGADLERTVVTSPVSGFVTYSLLDAYRIVVAHERRHLRQARRVTETPGFPASVSGSGFRVPGFELKTRRGPNP
ncbi:MAG TPA: DinB family protein [Pyrinomonadaceae bacterium]|nr:DinB family protein [Pyrinomonadaceae bacterium]